jgi:glycosyltransferase involved in cell wall biosynthesis
MPKFSICIPTRERHHTLPYSVASVLAQTYDDFEVIVQDNASSDETYKSLQQFNDPRLKYCRSDRRLSMHANWEAALDATSGEYVNYIGDDDALLPFCLERANEILKLGNVELLAWVAHTYYWPDVPDAPRRNHLSVDLRGGATWSKYVEPEAKTMDRSRFRATLPPATMSLDCKQILKNWLRHDGARFYIPTYHSLVSRQVIDRVKEATGDGYFLNPLPDFGTLIANLYVSDELIFHTAPLSMTGHSRSSSGGTHGHQESWDHRLANFIEESGWSKERLLPSVFRPFLWAPALLAGCFEDVKRRLFPDDDRFAIDWGNFLISAAAGVNAEPESIRDTCKAWVLESADQIGLSRNKIKFPEIPPYERQVGTLRDPHDRVVYIYIDGDVLGLKTVTDAVNVACTLDPINLYPVTFAPKWAQPEAAACVARTEGAAGARSTRLKRLWRDTASYRHELLKRGVRRSARVARDWNVYDLAVRFCPHTIKRVVRMVFTA